MKDMQNFKKVNTSSWDDLKDNLFVRLINERYLSQYGDIAHVKMMDLVMVFSVQEKIKDTMLSYLLTNEDLKNMNVEPYTVMTFAMHNSSNDRKRRIMTFKESTLKNNLMYPVLQIPKGMMMGAGGHSMAECGIIQDTDEEQECDNILILCNKHDTFGASYMVLPSILDEVYARFNEENFTLFHFLFIRLCVYVQVASRNGEKPRYEVEDDLLI